GEGGVRGAAGRPRGGPGPPGPPGGVVGGGPLMDTLLTWLHGQGVDFRVPELLWALLLVPALLVGYAGARRARRRVAGAFQVFGRRPPARPWAALGRSLALCLLLLGLA